MKKPISLENLSGLKEREGGLTSQEVQQQRSRFGANEIVERIGNPWLDLAHDTAKDPMVWFLVGVGLVFLLVGETKEAIILFSALIPLLFMDFFLHWRTQASTSSLKGQLASRARVLRDGKELELSSRELVPGDVVILTSSSERFLPADGIFEVTEGLQIDESALTGESFPVPKSAAPLSHFFLADQKTAFVDTNNLGYAGTRVLTGSGVLRVLVTGKSTEYGEVVQSVANVPHERTGLQLAISKLVRTLVIFAGLFCLILAAVRVYQGHGWLDALLSAATLAIAAIPEEFPVVFTFFLGVGVYRLAGRHALVRRAVSVENIGRVTWICSDKTGTITVGQLKLTHMDPASGTTEEDVLKIALAAADPTGADPVDIAIFELGQQKGLSTPKRGKVFPFTEDRRRESAIIEDSVKGLICYTKGAPETILSLSALSSEEMEDWRRKTSSWAMGGHKVLACAWIPLSQLDAAEPQEGFHFSGLLAFEDPPRPEVRGALDYCRENGIRVMMITGDHADTAGAIAKDIGLGNGVPIISSAEENPEKFEEAWLAENPNFVRSLDVVARCNPLQKFRIVNALKKSGALVAVTGDGVNDVPALKAADIGIAMGVRGTRSAKEVSSIILADDNFSTIVNAIREGRQLFLNIKRSFDYLLLFHIPFILTAALIPLLGYPLLYLPVHIVLLELVIHPTALFAFQQRAASKFNSARKQTELFSLRDGIRFVLIGVSPALAMAGTYLSTLSSGASLEYARAKVIALLIFWSAGLVVFLTIGRTLAANVVAALTICLGVFMVQVPKIAETLHLQPLRFIDWLASAGLVFLFLLMDVLIRKIGRICAVNPQGESTS